MMNIGEFGQTTGLTVKALRYYDEIDLLTPTDVDQATGYRRYEANQVKAGATIAVLRAMDVPLGQIGRYLQRPDQHSEVLDEVHEGILRARTRQDQMWTEGREVLVQYEIEREVAERHAPALPWVGIVAPLPEDDDETVIEERFEEVIEALASRGVIQVTGPFWSSFRAHGAKPEEVEVVYAIGVAAPIPAGVELDEDVISGLLPERRERCVRIEPAFAMSDTLAAPHPGVISMLTHGLEREIQGVRQVIVPGDGDAQAIELCVDVY